MKLGSRWSVGDAPPAGLPEALRSAIAEVEAALEADRRGRLRWTLSWLENRPSAELDDGPLLEVVADGSVVRSD